MSYKFDNLQIILIVALGINIFTILILPFEQTIAEQIPTRGYTSVINWIIIFLMVRMMLHSFGVELYNLNGAVFGLIALYIGSFLLKYIFFTDEFKEPIYSYVVITIITILAFVGFNYLDRAQYDVVVRGNGEDEIL